MKFKAIIFDMDGTIVDTEKIWESATKNLLHKKGVQLTQELSDKLANQLRGLATIKGCQILKETLNLQDSVPSLIDEQRQIAQQLYNNLKFINGFKQFHKKLTSFNLKTGIATNADDKTLEITKKILKLEKFFGKHIYNISHVNNMYKPFPHLYLHAANQLNVAPEQCIAIEDSKHGVTAAKNAGMFCIGINTANNTDLLCDADLIIQNYKEIDLDKILLL